MSTKPQPAPPKDTYWRGYAILTMNAHGAIEGFGPYGEGEMHEIASLCGLLVPTWVVDLDEQRVEKYGEPEHLGERDGHHEGPARRRAPRIVATLPNGCVEACAGSPHAPTCATNKPKDDDK